MTPFELAVKEIKERDKALPEIVYEGAKVDPMRYQLAASHFVLKILAKRITMKGQKLKDYKNYYGLKGKTAAECLVEFEEILNNYKKTI